MATRQNLTRIVTFLGWLVLSVWPLVCRLGLHPRGSGFALVARATPSWLGRLHRDTTINRRAAVAAENQRRVWSLERYSRVTKNTFLALIRLLRVRGEEKT